MLTTRNKRATLQPYVPKLQKNLHKMVNAQELKVIRQKLGLEAELDVAWHVQQTVGIGQTRPGIPQNARLVPPRGVDKNRDNMVLPHRPSVDPKGRVQHSAHIMYKEDYVDLDGAWTTVAIVLPTLPQGVKFTITGIMIQLFNLK